MRASGARNVTTITTLASIACDSFSATSTIDLPRASHLPTATTVLPAGTDACERARESG